MGLEWKQAGRYNFRVGTTERLLPIFFSHLRRPYPRQGHGLLHKDLN
jgi:hypothetical protein